MMAKDTIERKIRYRHFEIYKKKRNYLIKICKEDLASKGWLVLSFSSNLRDSFEHLGYLSGNIPMIFVGRKRILDKALTKSIIEAYKRGLNRVSFYLTILFH